MNNILNIFKTSNKKLITVTIAKALVAINATAILPFMAAYFVSTSEPISARVIGNGFAISSIIGLLGCFIGGYLVDKGVNWKVLFAIGGTISAASISLISYNNPTIVFYILFSMLGFGGGILGPPSDIAVERSRDGKLTNRGLAFTYSLFSSSIITIIAFLLLIILVEINKPDYAFIFGGLCTIFGVLIAVCINSGNNPREQSNEVSLLSKKQKINQDSLIQNNKAEGRRIIFKEIKKIIKIFNNQFIYVLILSFVFNSILQLEGSAVPIEFERMGISTDSHFLTTILGLLALRIVVFSIILLPIGNKYSKLPVKKGFQFGFAMYFAAMLLLSMSSKITLSPIVIIFLVQIFSALATAGLMPTTTRAVLDIVDKRNHGIALSFNNFSMATGNSIASVIGGYFLSKNLDAPFWLTIALICIGTYPITKYLSTKNTSNPKNLPK